jgi:hypothetical protein
MISAMVHVIIVVVVVVMMAEKVYGLRFNGVSSVALIYDTEVDKTHKGTRKDTPTFLIKLWRIKCLQSKQ